MQKLSEKAIKFNLYKDDKLLNFLKEILYLMINTSYEELLFYIYAVSGTVTYSKIYYIDHFIYQGQKDT